MLSVGDNIYFVYMADVSEGKRERKRGKEREKEKKKRENECVRKREKRVGEEQE